LTYDFLQMFKEIIFTENDKMSMEQ